MSRRVRRLFGLVVLVLSVAGTLSVSVAWSQSADDPKDPVVDGKKGSQWVDIVQNSPSARARALAVEALAKLWRDQLYEPALPNIGRALRVDPSAAVRAQAAIALSGLRPAELKVLPRNLLVLAENARKDLILAMGSEKESRVRREIAVALGRDPNLVKAALAELTAALKDPAPATIVAVADAIAQAGPDGRSAAAGLVPLLEHPDTTVRRAAVMALGRISPEGAAALAEVMAKMLTGETDPDLRAELLTSLGLLGERPAPVVAAVAVAATDPDDDLRRRAVRVLGSFGTAARTTADTLLKAAATDPHKDIRVDAVHGFGSVLGPEGLRSRLRDLLRLLNDPEHEVRIAVLDEIGALGPDLKDDLETLKAVRSRLSDPHLKVREAAALTLRKITEKKKDDSGSGPANKP